MGVQQLADRIENLERENGRLKLAGGAVVAVLLGAVLVRALMPQDVPHVLRTRRVEIIDEQGAVQAILGVGPSMELGLTLMDGDRIATQIERWTTTIYDPDDPARIVLNGSLGLHYYDYNNHRRVYIDGWGISVFDEHGNQRARLLPSGITYSDAEGNVIWRAPR